MNNLLEYKGLSGTVNYDSENRILHGKVINLTRDIINFQGRSVAELEQDFKEAVDFYLDMCEKEGVNPEKPFSGKFILRIPPDLHKRVVIAATNTKISINKFAEKALEHELNEYEGKK